MPQRKGFVSGAAIDAQDEANQHDRGKDAEDQNQEDADDGERHHGRHEGQVGHHHEECVGTPIEGEFGW